MSAYMCSLMVQEKRGVERKARFRGQTAEGGRHAISMMTSGKQFGTPVDSGEGSGGLARFQRFGKVRNCKSRIATPPASRHDANLAVRNGVGRSKSLREVTQ